MRAPATSKILLGALVLATQLVPDTAQADNKKSPLAGQPAIRHRIELRKRRFEITPQMQVSMNQDFRHFIGGGLVLNFHINDWLGIALQVAGGGGVDSALGSSISDKLIDEKSIPYNPDMASDRPKFQPSREQYNAHLGSINLLSSLYAQVTPMAGKLSIFGALYLRYDLYVMAGFGLMNITNSWADYKGVKAAAASSCMSSTSSPDPNTCDPLNGGIKPSFMWGLGLHLFFTDWLALNLELRDFVASTNMGGLDVDGNRALNKEDGSLSNNLFAGVGLTIMLPARAKVSE